MALSAFAGLSLELRRSRAVFVGPMYTFAPAPRQWEYQGRWRGVVVPAPGLHCCSESQIQTFATASV